MGTCVIKNSIMTEHNSYSSVGPGLLCQHNLVSESIKHNASIIGMILKPRIFIKTLICDIASDSCHNFIQNEAKVA